MTRLPDLSQERIVRALGRAGFIVVRQGKHVSMYNRERNVVAVTPRHNPVKRTTLARILKEIDITPEEFAKLV